MKGKTKKTYFDLYFKSGLHQLSQNPLLLAFFIIIIVLVSQALYRFDSCNNNLAVYSVILIAITILAVYRIGIPLQTANITEGLSQAGLLNHIGEPPVLISMHRRNDKDETGKKHKITEYLFFSAGTPLSDWESKMAEVESALNICIIDITPTDGNDKILMTAVPAQGALPENIQWNDKMMPKRNNVLLAGQGPTGNVAIDLSKTPHILIGGATGSGKTVLLKMLLHQCSMRGNRIFIFDLKGGVDFGIRWEQENHILCYDVNSIEKNMVKIVSILEERKKVLRDTGYSNIDDYNKADSNKMERIIIGSDEIAELFDTTGLTKEQKEQIMHVTNLMSTIARQGRAFGIHLIIATQRPDATILPGQIKSNISFRICGQADDILSRIILDNSLASEIPKTAQGRFITHNGTIFQAYFYDE